MPPSRLEFRIPISPTDGFFGQLRFFDFALRRLGGVYGSARLVVVVGDNCDLDQVRARNGWSGSSNIAWEKVPEEIFGEFGMQGTADWRYLFDDTDSEIVVLSDADTVLLRPIDALLERFRLDFPAIAGHMAHFPPPVAALRGGADSFSPEFWPRLFSRFDVPWPSQLYPYSMDSERRLPLCPAYFNLGFVVLNRHALSIFRSEILPLQRRLKAEVDSNMRCQIACTIVAYRAQMEISVLSAEYNAANDEQHLKNNNLLVEGIRVLHYLREEELVRQRIFQPEGLSAFLKTPLRNPANRALQRLAGEYAAYLTSAT